MLQLLVIRVCDSVASGKTKKIKETKTRYGILSCAGPYVHSSTRAALSTTYRHDTVAPPPNPRSTPLQNIQTSLALATGLLAHRPLCSHCHRLLLRKPNPSMADTQLTRAMVAALVSLLTAYICACAAAFVLFLFLQRRDPLSRPPILQKRHLVRKYRQHS